MKAFFSFALLFSTIFATPSGFHVEADYFHVWRTKPDIPPLLVTAPAGVEPNLNGSETKVIFGGCNVGDDPQPALKGAIDWWFCDCIALRVGGFWSMDQEKSVSVASDSAGIPSIGIPFYNVFSGSESANFVALEDEWSGNASAKRKNQVWGANIAFNYDLGCNRGVNFVCHLGYQHFDVDDFVVLQASSERIPGAESFDITNRFSCDNLFDGGLIGLGANWGCGRFGTSVLAKFNFGAMRSKVAIEGSGEVDPAVQFIGFVQDSNRGTCQKDFFTTVLELDSKLTYRVCHNLTASIGYSILYWPRVYLAGKQIDRNINPFDASIYPERFNKKNSFWMQGITVGLSGCF